MHHRAESDFIFFWIFLLLVGVAYFGLILMIMNVLFINLENWIRGLFSKRTKTTISDLSHD